MSNSTSSDQEFRAPIKSEFMLVFDRTEDDYNENHDEFLYADDLEGLKTAILSYVEQNCSAYDFGWGCLNPEKVRAGFGFSVFNQVFRYRTLYQVQTIETPFELHVLVGQRACDRQVVEQMFADLQGSPALQAVVDTLITRYQRERDQDRQRRAQSLRKELEALEHEN